MKPTNTTVCKIPINILTILYGNVAENILPFIRIPNISVNKQRIHFRMYIFHCNLESVEASSFSHLHFLWEPLHKVLVDNAIWSGKESQDMLDEVPLTILQALPVGQIL